jgi:hypothetical protein
VKACAEEIKTILSAEIRKILVEAYWRKLYAEEREKQRRAIQGARSTESL